MKTTVVLPDDLVVSAKQVAARDRTNLRSLVESGLRRELAARKESQEHPVRALMALDPSPWRGVDADAYVAQRREDW